MFLLQNSVLRKKLSNLLFVINIYFKIFRHEVLQMQTLVILCQSPNATIPAKIKNNFIIQAQKISEETKRQSYIKCKSAKAKNITKWVFEQQKLNPCLYKIFLIVFNPFASRDIKKSKREVEWKLEERNCVLKVDCVLSL